jgi:hypothetical protein
LEDQFPQKMIIRFWPESSMATARQIFRNAARSSASIEPFAKVGQFLFVND